MSSAEKGGVFHRRADKRLVKNVVSTQHCPSNWVPMDLWNTQCKLMEVRKYSAGYHELDTKFRKPSLELITAYAVQNPFLLGCYNLRKEQLKLDGQPTVREKIVYVPVAFECLDSVIRNGFAPGTTGISSMPVGGSYSNQAVAFYPDSESANSVIPKFTNPRILIVAKILVGVCQLLPEEECEGFCLSNQTNSKGERVDTFTNEQKEAFLKSMMTETYPESVIVYRAKNGPSPDTRSSRIADVIKQGCVVSYRSGTRYNPDEARFNSKSDEGGHKEGGSLGSKTQAKKKSTKTSSKKPKKTIESKNENTDPNAHTREQIEGIELVERDGCGVEGSDQEKNRCHQVAYPTTTATVHNEKN